MKEVTRKWILRDAHLGRENGEEMVNSSGGALNKVIRNVHVYNFRPEHFHLDD